MKKVLFIDRDGTLIDEPPITFQVDSLEKLSFLPTVFYYLRKIAEELDYELVMVTNQDGLGTDSFPEDTFWPVQNKMIQAFENEGIVFSEILIDRTFEEENKNTRKPGIGMMTNYLNGNFDLANSFVLGDRKTDMQLAENIGSKGILLSESEAEFYSNQIQVLNTLKWSEVYNYLSSIDRISRIKRKTNETDISVILNLNGSGKSRIDTGLKFFDHMLEQIAKHGMVDLEITTIGDLQVDEHHTIEDTAIALGSAFKQALGKKNGIERYGFCLPMDDCKAQVLIDFGGRNWIEWEAEFNREKVGDMPTEMFYHFFKSFSDGAACNLNIKAFGNNEHHKIEAIFKCLAKAIKMAIKQDKEKMFLPTTKGMI